MKYKVRVSQVRYGETVVEANSEEEAKTVATGVAVDYFDEEITDMTAEPMGDGRTYIVTELCPHCQSEIEMKWNTDIDGYKAFCPVCGKRLMLCDECRHSEDIGGCDYNSERDTCKHNEQDTATLEIDTPLGTLVAGRTPDPDYPGIWLDLQREGAEGSLSLAHTEYDPEKEQLVTRVWGDGKNEDYTVRTEHENVEDFFQAE